MRILHFADLHLGKRVNDFSMIDNQRYILDQIIEIIKKNQVEAVIIAGDIYDKSIPSIEAVELFDIFINKLSSLKIKVFIIAGNHDSAKRMSFGNKLIDKSEIYIRGNYNRLEAITILKDGLKYNFYLLPFCKPSDIRALYPEKTIETYQDMMEVIINDCDIVRNDINILITHHFIVGSEFSGSEMMSVGELSGITADIFKDFDYVALGHIHRPQKVHKPTIRYSGSILKYSIKEINQRKSVTLLDIQNKKDLKIKEIELEPLQDIVYIKEYFDTLKSKAFYQDLNLNNFYVFELKDQKNIPMALEILRTIYPNIMSLSYQGTKQNLKLKTDEYQVLSPLEMIEKFYQIQLDKKISNDEKEYILKILGDISNEA